MDDNKFENNLNDVPETTDTELLNEEQTDEVVTPTPEETDAVEEAMALEENDNWNFEAEAMTLKDTVIENDEMEITLPDKTVSETRERPKAPTKTAVQTAPAPKSDGKNTTKFILAAIVIVLVAGVLAFFGIRYYTVPNTNEVMNPGNTVMKVGDIPVSLGMYNYYYNSTVNTYTQQAQYLGLDTTVSYASQETTDDDGNTITWQERFQKDTVDQIKQLTALYQEAVADGVELTEEQQEQIDSSVESVTQAASDQDMSVDEYISTTYGDYCGLATIKKMLNWTLIAQTYYLELDTKLVPDEERVNQYFEEHKEDYMNVDVTYLIVPYTEETKDDAVAKAQEYAAQIKSDEDLLALVPEACAEIIASYIDYGYFSTEEECIEAITPQLSTTISKESGMFPTEIEEWAFSEEAPVSSTFTYADDDSMVVFVLIKDSEPTLLDDDVYSVRHILIQPESAEEQEETAETTETAEEPEYTEEEWTAAEAKANEVYDEYMSGDKTEYAFAQLAEEYSSDPGSTYAQSGVYGGLYSNITKGYMVEEFENWALDESRVYGDTDIVKTKYGYHIMFFVDRGPIYLSYCKSDVKAEMEDEIIDSYSCKEYKSVMKKTTVAKPTPATETAQ